MSLSRLMLKLPGCGRRSSLPLLLASLAASGGCAQLGYQQIRIGQEAREYRRALPEGRTIRTTAGVAYLEQDLLGKTDAIVLLLTRDQRVAGKFHAQHQRRDLGFRIETCYSLQGELDPQLIRLAGAGPLDMLRAIADELTRDEADTAARAAHDWVAAGLVRLVQHWPHVGDEGPAFPRLTEMLARVPGGGLARITVLPNGNHVVEYAHTAQQ